MNCRVVDKNGIKYVEGLNGKRLIESANDALEMLVYCGENDTNRLMLHATNLNDDFFNLKTGLAGEILQKFVNYHIKFAIVLSPELVGQGRFREMVLEANRGQHFRIFYDVQEAEAWLVSNN